ncbi:uncharacterized protein LOC112270708 [Brachypodium distachyon]|uniref:uncharacterized protein LOC112270708 n=1 Tax=Brachypodium distachyon TaxID=15368 RepID=UPI000D0CAE7B|nr:uncharacterized protein LOC112270708 [Brachypodium distachyon]|eukprot:XP_024314513.1 uncharacterized protein LOC112270708 [Brachypodium distachyon]
MPLPAQQPGISRRVISDLYCVVHGETHRLRVAGDTGGARFFGAYEGGWLFLALQHHRGHEIENIHNGRRILVPDSVTWVRVEVGEEEPSGAAYRDPEAGPMVIFAAALSSSPVGSDAPCVAAAIIQSADTSHFPLMPQIAFWLVEDGAERHQIVHAPVTLEDVAHQGGFFHFLTSGENLISIRQEQAMAMGTLQEIFHLFQPREPVECGENEVLAGRYLVESRGELLLVVRCSVVQSTFGHGQASRFLVFQITRHLQQQRRQVATGGKVEILTWTLLPGLNGRMIFLAHGCSRSYDVADFPGCEEGVYYLDDTRSLSPTFRSYLCSDNGMCPGNGDSIRRLFQYRAASANSSPVWFLA